MANLSKNIWVPAVLIIAAAGILLFSLGRKQEAPKSVVMQEVFNQTPQAGAEQPAVDAAAKDPIPSPAIVTNPENGHEAEFTVQVYSFRDRARADRALESLKSAGYNGAFMEVSDLGEKGTWYRVRIGGIANEDQAKAILDEVRKSYNSGFIVKPRK